MNNPPKRHFLLKFFVLFALPICVCVSYLNMAIASPTTQSAITATLDSKSTIGSNLIITPTLDTQKTDENTSASHGSMKPHHVFNLHIIPVTNAMISTWIVAVLMIIASIFFYFSIKTNRFKKYTGLVEFSVLTLFSFLQELIGSRLTQRVFWFLGSLFFFILFLNWTELVPGVGSIGWGQITTEGFMVNKPILRCGSSDLNLTLAFGALFFIFWFFLAIKNQGVTGFILHIFGPKGESKGLMAIVMLVIFIAVGFLEVISIIVRPFSLALRLYGNTLAGGVLIETMMKKIPALAWLIPLPFYFMEAMVGFIQAFVFTLLSAIFIMLVCNQEDETEIGHDPHNVQIN